MVEFTDGATIAQLSHARHAPARSATPWPSPTGSPPRSAASTGPTCGPLDFEPPDLDAFPCLGLAYEAGRAGGTAPAWLNAANEVAVAAFLDGRIRLDRRSPTSSTGSSPGMMGPRPTASTTSIEADRRGPRGGHARPIESGATPMTDTQPDRRPRRTPTAAGSARPRRPSGERPSRRDRRRSGVGAAGRSARAAAAGSPGQLVRTCWSSSSASWS